MGAAGSSIARLIRFRSTPFHAGCDQASDLEGGRPEAWRRRRAGGSERWRPGGRADAAFGSASILFAHRCSASPGARPLAMTFSRSPGWSSMTAHSAPCRRRVGTVVEAAGLPRRRAVPRVADRGDRCCPQPGRCVCGALGDALWPEGKWRDDQISEYPDRLGCVPGFGEVANAAPPPSAWQLGRWPLFSSRVEGMREGRCRQRGPGGGRGEPRLGKSPAALGSTGHSRAEPVSTDFGVAAPLSLQRGTRPPSSRSSFALGGDGKFARDCWRFTIRFDAWLPRLLTSC